MTKDEGDVVGGEIALLWGVANRHLPDAQNAYYEQIEQVHKVNGNPDDQKYGKCHPWWTALACELERGMFNTVSSMAIAAIVVDKAVDAYVHVDGDNAKGLTAIGEEFKETLGDTKEVEVNKPEGWDGPNFNLPDSWGDERDE